MKKTLPLIVQLVLFLWLTAPHAYRLQARSATPPTPEHRTHTEKTKPPVTDPPEFPEVPADTTVNCASDALPAFALLATDDNDPSFPKLVSPVDSPTPGAIGCAGGTITRTWTATDADGQSTTVTQNITVLPDDDPPVILAPEPSDTINCEAVTPTTWTTWLNSKELSLATQIEECNIDRIENDAPPSFDTYCGSITVTFTVFDDCGASADWHATLTIIDETPPLLIGVPVTDDTISCADPIPPAPNVTATDNCTVELTVQFQEASGQTMDGTCSQYDYVINRTWSVVDSCGNLTTGMYRVLVRDNQPPTFTRPPNLTLSCTDDPTNLAVTGNVLDAADDCDPDPEVVYIDTTIPGPDCPQNYQIQRTWLVSDVCGNTTGKIQIITVEDSEAPTFDVPGDLILDCSDSTDPAATGEPANVSDNCDTDPVVTYSDVVIQGSCLNEESIQRYWQVTDACGNLTQKIQTIEIIDTQRPVFSQPPTDEVLTCTDETDPDETFENWWTNRGGAAAFDNCSLTTDLQWFIYNAGTTDAPTLPPLTCPAPGGVLREQTVDFIVADECGNRDTLSATFRVVDNEAPQLSQCPPDQTIPTDPGQCTATFTLAAPVIIDACATGRSTVNASDSAPITTSAPPGQEGTTPVDPIQLDLAIAHPLPVNATGDANLLVQLFTADAEGDTEYFNVLGEDGSLLGRTGKAQVASGCGDSDTTLTVSAALINAWASDGIVTVHLEPNVPSNQSGAFAINAVCNMQGTAAAALNFSARDFTGLRYEYRLDDGARTAVDPVGPVTLNLTQGPHLIRYYATDCTGNSDSCSYQVTVVDSEPPVLNCPADIAAVLPAGECTVDIALPFPPGAADNCAVGTPLMQTAPNDTAAARLTFAYDPNLNTYQAQEKTYTFTGLNANAGEDVLLSLSLLGDFNSNGAFLEVYGDDGSLLGNTTVGAASCNATGQAAFTIPQTTYNEWAADGAITITLQPNEITVPPGVPGDGINPCDPGAVTSDGDDDGQSYVFATLSGQNLQPSYFADGATVLPNTVFGPQNAPVHTFNPGETTVSYLIEDTAGNTDTCSFTVTVEDQELPMARCLPTTLFINPGGTVVETVDPMLIDDGSTDNCAIDTMFLSPGTFDCLDADALVDVTLTVIDLAGNQDTCHTFVRVELEEPAPTSNATDGLCAGDTLCLMANPPAAPGGVVYTYAWSGPSNFTSTSANPCIPNVTTANSGTYTVSITGITGCTVSGSVEVAVQGLPTTPEVLTDQNICINEDIELVSSVSPSGQDVVYRWFRGTPPNGILLAETTEASYSIPGPQNIPAGSNTTTVRYYLEVVRDGCFSETSAPVAITISRIPTAQVNVDQVVLCEGGMFAPGTPLSDPGLTFEWNGPDGYFSTNQNPPVVSPVTPAKAGPYVLTVLRNGCPSAPDTTLLTVIPKPPTPLIFNNGPACVGEDILLSTNVANASSYEWQSSAMPDPIPTAGNTLLLSDVTLSDVANWRVRVTQAGCISDYSVPTPVVVNPLPATVASAVDESVCESDTIRLLGAPDVATYSYQWFGPAGFSSQMADPVITQNVNDDRAGSYVLTVTSDAGCTRSDSVTIDILPTVSILGLTNDGEECMPTPTDVRLVAAVAPADDGSYEYLWTGPGPGITIQPDPNCASCAVVQDATEDDNGIYRLVVRTGEGCASEPDTTLVNISGPPATPGAPLVSDATPAPFCEGEPITLTTTPVQGNNIIYYWTLPGGDIQPTTTASLNIADADEEEHEGLYSLRVSVDGCLSAQSPEVNLNIRPVPVATPMSNSPVCSGDTLQLMTALDPGANYFWTGPLLFNSSLPNPAITNAGVNRSGYYRLQAELNGCFSRLDSVFVTVNPSPQTPVAANDGPVCLDQATAEVTLSVDPASATAGALYTWSGPGGQPVGETPLLDLTLSDLGSYGNGVFPFSVQAELGNCPSGTIITQVQLNTIPAEPAEAGADTTLCEVDDLRLDAQAPPLGAGAWSLLSGDPTGVTILDPNDPRSAIEGLTGGESYGFLWTLSNGACLNYDQDSVDISVTPGEVPVAGADFKACITDEIILDAQPTENGTGMWTQPGEQDSLGVAIADPFDPNTRVTGLNPDNTYIFTWSVVSGCGSGEDDVLVIISDPNADAGRDTIICNESGFVRLNADPPTLGSSGMWTSLNPEVLLDNPNSPTPLAMDLAPGVNRFVWIIDDALCDALSVDTVTVTRKMPPAAQDDEVTVPFGEPVTIDLLVNDDFASGSTTEAVTLPANGELEKIAEGRYIYRPDITFAGIDQFRYQLCSDGCDCAEALVTLLVGEDAACDIPNVITPNGDNVNDVFVVPCLLNTDLYPQSQVSIFNRWGDEVFRSERPYQSTWNGTFNGEDLPDGTYFYLIDFGNGREPASGFIMIQR